MHPLPELEYVRTRDVSQALLLGHGQGCRYIAGGTDLVPNMRRGLLPAQRLVDVSELPELRRVAALEDGSLGIGAATTLAELAAHPLVASHVPALAAAARAVAGPQHRIAATLGGNLCQDTRCIFYNQSEWWRASNGFCLKLRGTRCHVAPQGDRCHAAFCSDLAPVLLAANASVRLAGAGRTRTIPLLDMYRDDGAAHLTLGAGELLARVVVPAIDGTIVYGKLRQRGAMDFPLAAIAVTVTPRGARVALSATGSCPVVFDLLGEESDAGLRSAILRHAGCARTTSTPPEYRREAAAALAARLLAEARAL